jgi:hypothetical protein
MYCYSFPSRQKFRALAAAEGLINEDDRLITASHEHAIDEIGLIHKDGKALPGWHVNYVGKPPESWSKYQVLVKSLARVFCGSATAEQALSQQ